jgi:putative PIN family toxin of toxin-antitoxin system
MTLRVVIDTSCLVSYLLTRGTLMCQVIEHWRNGNLTLLSSASTRAELAAVLARPAIQQRTVSPMDELMAGLARFTEHVPAQLPPARVCRDPKDDKFLACAAEGQAHYLVTGDKDLLTLRCYEGTAIVNPGQFVLALELHAADAASLAERFGHKVLSEILEAIPLDPETSARVREAVGLSSQGPAGSKP